MRAASRFVQVSQQFQSEVRVSCNGRAADARSLLDLITLVAERGAGSTSRRPGSMAARPSPRFPRSSRPSFTRARTSKTSDSIPDSLN